MMDNQTKDELKAHVKDMNVWKRLFFIVLFAILYYAAQVIVVVVVLFQFLTVLLTGSKNDKVLTFGSQLSTYAYQVFQFLTFNTDTQPFPMSDWPSGKPLTEKDAAAEKPKRAPRKPAARKSPPKKASPKTEEKKEKTPAAEDGVTKPE